MARQQALIDRAERLQRHGETDLDCSVPEFVAMEAMADIRAYCHVHNVDFYTVERRSYSTYCKELGQ